MSYVDFMASVLMLMTAMAPATAVIQSRKFSNHQDLADVSFADGVTFESQARSTVDCLRICSAKSCCCRFTFVESGSTRGCLSRVSDAADVWQLQNVCCGIQDVRTALGKNVR